MGNERLARALETPQGKVFLPPGRRFGRRFSCTRCGTLLYPRSVVWYPEDQDIPRGDVPQPYCRHAAGDEEGRSCAQLVFLEEVWADFTRERVEAQLERMSREGFSQRDIDAKAYYYGIEKRRKPF